MKLERELETCRAVTSLCCEKRSAVPEGDAGSDVERLKVSLRAVKEYVTGERVPNWDGEGRTYLTRGKIADICDFALAHPHHPRDIHLTIEKRGVQPPPQSSEGSCYDPNETRDSDYYDGTDAASGAYTRGETMTKEDLLAALRPFALWADSMYTLKDEDNVCGIYVRHFRDAAKMVRQCDDDAAQDWWKSGEALTANQMDAMCGDCDTTDR